MGVCTSSHVCARDFHPYSSVTVTSALAAMTARLAISLIQDPNAYPRIPDFLLATVLRTPRHPILTSGAQGAGETRQMHKYTNIIECCHALSLSITQVNNTMNPLRLVSNDMTVMLICGNRVSSSFVPALRYTSVQKFTNFVIVTKSKFVHLCST